MLIRTWIDWNQQKELDPEKKERIEARLEFDPDYDAYDDLIEETEKEALIDTDGEKMYIQCEPEKICMTKLLGGEYMISPSGGIQRYEERVFFQGTLDEIESNINNNKTKENGTRNKGKWSLNNLFKR